MPKSSRRPAARKTVPRKRSAKRYGTTLELIGNAVPVPPAAPIIAAAAAFAAARLPAVPESQEDLEARLSFLGPIDDDTKRSVACALVGHSGIVEVCFGQVTCGRCGTVLGDTLVGSYSLKGKVVRGHKCDDCKTAMATLGWRDTYLTPDPLV